MTHDAYRELMQREADGDLSPEEASLLESHVESCAACRLEREEYRSLFLGLSQLSHMKPERSFVPQLELEIKRAVEQANPPRQPQRFIPARWRGLSVAAVAVLAVGLAVYGPFSHAGNTTGSSTGSQIAMQPDSGAAPTADADKKVQTFGNSQTPADDAPTHDEMPKDTPSAAGPDAVSPKSAPASKQLDAGKQLALAPSTAPAKGGTLKQDASPAASSTEAVKKPDPATTGAAAASDEKSSTSSAGVSLPHGIGGGINQGITGNSADAGRPTALSVPQLGAAPALPALNASLQQAAASGDASAAWALNASQVVEQNLVPLGFSASASVSAASQADRVRVVQRGITYEVRLNQPFQSGPQGIWRPETIGRVIDQSSPDMAERPILAYFQKGGALQGDIIATGAFTDNSLPVAVDLLENGTVKTHRYLVKVKQDADGFYVLDGSPVER